MKTFLRSLFLTRRTFWAGWALVVLFALAQALPPLLDVALGLYAIFLVLLLGEAFVLYRLQKGISAARQTREKWSNGDENPVNVQVTNHYPMPVRVRILDELPVQFQKRDLVFNGNMSGGATVTFPYAVRPVERGLYRYGAINVMVSTVLGLVERRYPLEADRSVSVYPSFIHLRRYDMMAVSDRLLMPGQRKVRRASQQNEFEHVREYVSGDDRRTLNQKATARRGRLMVNQYQDERSQSVYAMIDAGRTMKMPFDGLSLLDYSINAALAISSVAMRKEDRAGLIVFSDKVHTALGAGRERGHMNRIMETLHAQRTDHAETDMDALYVAVKRSVPQRSLLLLFTNFESMNGLRRQLPRLRSLAAAHRLVVIFFRNTGIEEDLQAPVNDTAELYVRTITERYAFEKKLVAKELERHGIATVLTRPENLTVDTINKYLELKARGTI